MISQDPIKKAPLWTIVQSGNRDANRLWINDRNWSGICDGTPYADLDIDTRDVTEHLKVGKNTIYFQAVEDYAVPSGSFLVVEIEPAAKDVSHPNTGLNGQDAKGNAKMANYQVRGWIVTLWIIVIRTSPRNLCLFDEQP